MSQKRDIFSMLAQQKNKSLGIEDPEDVADGKVVKKVKQEAVPEAGQPAQQEEAVDNTELEFDSDTEKKDHEEAKELLKAPTVKSDVTLSKTDPIPYASVAKVFGEIEQTSKRLEIIQLASEFFLQVLETNPDDLIPITYLFINRLGPDYEGLELGLGETILIKTISESTGKSTQFVKNKYRETGDLGLIALQARAVQPTMFKPKPLDVPTVFNDLKKIATITGTNSQQKKINIIKKLLTAASGLEAKFLIRSLEAKLRIGLAEKTVLVSLAKALLIFQSKSQKVTEDMLISAEEQIRDSFCQIPNYEIIIRTAIEHGILNLKDHCKLRPGIPLKPMLAKPTKSIGEVLDRFTGEEFTCEYKYDGERAQVHLSANGQISIYSRNSEDMSQRYPDLILHFNNFLKQNPDIKSLILDCEAVAWDRVENKILPFQVLSTRKRKDVNTEDIKVQVCLFAFDILYYNDESLIQLPLRQRRDYLYKVLKPIEGEFQFATNKITADVEELQAFLEESIKNGCEGLMVKTLDSDPYRPSQRSNSWLKLKKDYLAGVGDSLDLIVVGAYYGRGKRTGKYGGFLLGCYNQDTEEIETCCKIGTGFSDEMLQQLYEKLSQTVVSEPLNYVSYDPSAAPDVWFEPSVLFEVLTADLSLSPIYKAGANVLDRGVSLRFPRFIRLRDDKKVEDATSSDQIVEFYERQNL